jgi:hypothetical protein
MPAKRFVPLAKRHKTTLFVRPESTGVQLVPLLVERNTPPSVAAQRFMPLTARDQTFVSVKPELI